MYVVEGGGPVLCGRKTPSVTENVPEYRRMRCRRNPVCDDVDARFAERPVTDTHAPRAVMAFLCVISGRAAGRKCIVEPEEIRGGKAVGDVGKAGVPLSAATTR